MNAYKIRKYIAAIIAVLVSVLLTLWTGAQPLFCAYAAEFTAYDKTTIEDDLRSLNIGNYPKNTGEKHRLLDEAGFMEYGFSQSTFIADNYFGIYFYLYNPCEREISTRAGANVVNMAVEYDTEGNPIKYENCSITFLDCTSNHRFYKFRLTNSADVYARALAYSKAHEGKRRYDIGSIQVWYLGDQNATDSFVGKGDRADCDGISYTYFCKGYAAGCGAEGNDQSTLSVERQKLETISLDIHSTWFRTDFNDPYASYSATTLSSVYFAIPKRFITEYGQLQIVKAEWYEYKTNYIFVTDSDEVMKEVEPYLGYEIPLDEKGNRYDPKIPFSIYHYLGPSDSGQQGLGYNKQKSKEQLSRIDALIQQNNLNKIVAPKVVQDCFENYPIYEGDEILEVGEKKFNANLFSEEVDEGHKRGYNVHEFDARNKADWLDITLENTTSDWDKFLNIFRPNNQVHNYLTENDILPIVEIKAEDLNVPRSQAAKKIFVDESEIDELKDYQKKAESENNAVYILRFSTSQYIAYEMEFHKDSDWTGLDYKTMYAARDTVYLSFDIIHLGFVLGDDVKIIPVVASPIDIYPALQPPPSVESQISELVWWLVGIAGSSILAVVITELAKRSEVRR